MQRREIFIQAEKWERGIEIRVLRPIYMSCQKKKKKTAPKIEKQDQKYQSILITNYLHITHHEIYKSKKKMYDRKSKFWDIPSRWWARG